MHKYIRHRIVPFIATIAVAALLTGCGKKTAPAPGAGAKESEEATFDNITQGEEFKISETEKKKVLEELGVSGAEQGGDIEVGKKLTEAEKAEAKRKLEERKAQRGEAPAGQAPAAPAAPGTPGAQPPAAGQPAAPGAPAAAAPAAPRPAPSGVGGGKELTAEGRVASRSCKQCEFYLNENDLTLALQKADAFIVANPNMAEGYLAKAVILRRQRKLEDAELEVRRALGFDKDHEWAVNYLAMILRDEGRLKPAIWTLEEYRTKYPNSLPTLYSLGILYDIYAGFKAKALVTYVDYLKRGGKKQKEVNVWIDSLSITLGVERPDTPGMDKPEPPAAAPAATPPAAAPAAPGQPAGAAAPAAGTTPAAAPAPAAGAQPAAAQPAKPGAAPAAAPAAEKSAPKTEPAPAEKAAPEKAPVKAPAKAPAKKK